MNKRISFYSQNTNLSPSKPKTSLRHLKLDIQEFHKKYDLVPADKAADNVVVWRLHYVNTLQQELGGTKVYELQPLVEGGSVVNDHICYSATKFAVCVSEGQDKLPTLYWLPKLHKRPYKARFIANSSSCTTTKLSKLLTSCLTAIKNHVLKYFDSFRKIREKSVLVYKKFEWGFK